MKIEILVHENGPVRKLLTKPSLARTMSQERALGSRFMWREDEHGHGYRLTPLGVLNKVGVYLHVVGWTEEFPPGTECKHS